MPRVLVFALTRGQFNARRVELAKDGLTVSADAGTLDYKGVEVAYSYNGTDTLTVTVQHKPWLIPESVVDEKITDWFSDPV